MENKTDFIEVTDINGKSFILNKKYIVKLERGERNIGTMIFIDTTVNPYQLPPYIPTGIDYDVIKLSFI